MTTTVYGKKYDQGLGTAEIAKAFRADLKAAIKAGELPAALRCSVRIKRFAGGSSIDVEATMPSDFVMYSEDYLAGRCDYSGTLRYSEGARALLKTLEDLLGAYNFDGSDLMSDYFHVRFYAHVRFARLLVE